MYQNKGDKNMSNWTHVAGVIRIDDLRFDNNTTPNFEKLIGKECLFNAPHEVWEDADNHPHNFLPMGGEGTLRKTVWINPNRDCVAAYVVTIFGDLRGHDDPNAIIRWFKGKIKEILETYWVRQATITADNEYNGSAEWSFDPEAELKDENSNWCEI